MTSTIDWAHEIDASLHGVDQPHAAYVAASLNAHWHRPHARRPSGPGFTDYVTDRGPHVRRLAHAICCDWVQAEAFVVDTLPGSTTGGTASQAPRTPTRSSTVLWPGWS